MMEPIKLLSRRERAVVALLLQGKSNKQIALSLGISERTIEFHLRNIYSKLQVSSRVELILKLGKATGSISEKPVESTVDVTHENIDNGNQSGRPRAAQAWRNTVSLIKKEVAMTLRISFEDLENYLRSQPILFNLLVFLAISLTTRYVVFDVGVYFRVSYILLGFILSAVSIYIGFSWKKMWSRNFRFHPLVIIAVVALLPFIAAGFDQIYINTGLRNTGPISTAISNIRDEDSPIWSPDGTKIAFASNRDGNEEIYVMDAEWVVSPRGESYLYKERHTTSDYLWLWANAFMILIFFISRIVGKRFDKDTLATA